MYNTKSTDWFREGVKKNRFKTALLDVALETYIFSSNHKFRGYVHSYGRNTLLVKT